MVGSYRTVWGTAVLILLGACLGGCGSAPCGSDSDGLYYLPYEAGTAHLMVQGNHGPFSHQNENALDFWMPMHTPILAARGGTVVKAIDTFTETCWLSQDCEGNRVIIQHDDGTCARYWHIEAGGVRVKVGDQVKRGDLIAFSGQTGVAFGPHLHFSVRDCHDKSLEVHFSDVCENDGVPVTLHRYVSRNNPETGS